MTDACDSTTPNRKQLQFWVVGELTDQAAWFGGDLELNIVAATYWDTHEGALSPGVEPYEFVA